MVAGYDRRGGRQWAVTIRYAAGGETGTPGPGGEGAGDGAARAGGGHGSNERVGQSRRGAVTTSTAVARPGGEGDDDLAMQG